VLQGADNAAWFVYILRCRNGSLYTGISTDIDRRLQEHRSGKRGARALRGNWPERVVFSCVLRSRSDAQRLEYRIKQLTRQQKQALIVGHVAVEDLLQGENVQVQRLTGGAEMLNDQDDNG